MFSLYIFLLNWLKKVFSYISRSRNENEKYPSGLLLNKLQLFRISGSLKITQNCRLLPIKFYCVFFVPLSANYHANFMVTEDPARKTK